jgi:hypothetical protein
MSVAVSGSVILPRTPPGSAGSISAPEGIPAMTTRNMLPRLTPWVLLAASLVLGAGTVFADMNGRTGKAQSATGCNCHGTTRTASVVTTITGPQSVTTGSTNQYTVSVSGGFAGTLGGFNLNASGGTLAAGANNQVSGTEVTHLDPNSRSWTFSWTAPATAGPQNFWAIAQVVDGGLDTSGDMWNWFGGVVNTPFAITVTNAAGVGESQSLAWLATPSPNPCVSGTRIAFSLASAASVRLEVLDAAGRRVRTLARGVLPAGGQSVSWDGRSESGSRVPAGVYFVHLSTPRGEYRTHLTVVN